MRKLLYITFIITVFTYFDLGLFEKPQILLQHPFIIILTLYLTFHYRYIPKKITIISLLFIIVGACNIFLGNNTLGAFAKVFSALYINFFFFYFMLKYIDFNPSRLFSVYMYGSILVSCLLLFQHLSIIIGFKYGYDVRYLGLNIGIENGVILPAAFFGEPANYATTISPAMFIALLNLLTKNNNYISFPLSFIVVLAYVLTFSSTGYIALFIAITLIAINYRTFSALFIGIMLSLFSFYLLYNNVPKFKMRVDDSKVVFIDNNLKDKKVMLYNGSTMALYNNYYIAIKNFLAHPLFGTGIGSHPIAYDRYNLFKGKYWWGDLNKDDANSLFSRLISETGLFGIILYFYFILKFRLSKSNNINSKFWVESNAILVLLLINLVRNGHYVSYGFPSFILMYYYFFELEKNICNKKATT